MAEQPARVTSLDDLKALLALQDTEPAVPGRRKLVSPLERLTRQGLFGRLVNELARQTPRAPTERLTGPLGRAGAAAARASREADIFSEFEERRRARSPELDLARGQAQARQFTQRRDVTVEPPEVGEPVTTPSRPGLVPGVRMRPQDLAPDVPEETQFGRSVVRGVRPRIREGGITELREGAETFRDPSFPEAVAAERALEGADEPDRGGSDFGRFLGLRETAQGRPVTGDEMLDARREFTAAGRTEPSQAGAFQNALQRLRQFGIGTDFSSATPVSLSELQRVAQALVAQPNAQVVSKVDLEEDAAETGRSLEDVLAEAASEGLIVVEPLR